MYVRMYAHNFEQIINLYIDLILYRRKLGAKNSKNLFQKQSTTKNMLDHRFYSALYGYVHMIASILFKLAFSLDS